MVVPPYEVVPERQDTTFPLLSGLLSAFCCPPLPVLLIEWTQFEEPIQ